MATGYYPCWEGRVNQDIPPQPTNACPSQALFSNRNLRLRYWLPDPPGNNFPALQTFWERLSTGITAYRKVAGISGPKLFSQPAAGATVAGWLQAGNSRRQSHSPNWSGASVRAVSGGTFSQVVGSWTEPEVERCGTYNIAQEFRSSIWVGFNGHASFADAALPQIGTSQQIVCENQSGGWQKKHWVWFEWWANTEDSGQASNVKPIYIDLDVEPGDTVLCGIELVPGTTADPSPFVARMCICVEHLDETTEPPSLRKVLVMPFIVHPPTIDNRRVQVSGASANWIAELPHFLPPITQPFLMPRFGPGPTCDSALEFAHCVAARTPLLGQTMDTEVTLAVSRRINMFGLQADEDTRVVPVATTRTPRQSDTEFAIRVDGNGS